MEQPIRDYVTGTVAQLSITEDTYLMFMDFVHACVNDKHFIAGSNKILPFDNALQADMILINNPIKSIGISLMRMDMEPALFSFGISVNLVKGNLKITEYIIACQSIDNIKQYTKSEKFRHQIKQFFSNNIQKEGGNL